MKNFKTMKKLKWILEMLIKQNTTKTEIKNKAK